MPVDSLEQLDKYCKRTLIRSTRQHERFGSLEDEAHRALANPGIWDHEWAPPELDYGRAAEHPVHQAFTREQKLAWSHLHWVMDYITVAQGEQQVVILNGMAARRFAAVCPSVCALQERESAEEADHVAAFFLVKDAVEARYFPRDVPLRVDATSGTRSGRLNRGIRWLIGEGADRIFGSNFPTLFFMTRGMKSHAFKPFEIAYSRHEPSHPAIRALSELHGWDESRHIASAQHLARLANPILDAVPQENQFLFRLAMERLWPRGRVVDYRASYWRRCLAHATVFASVPSEDREALADHIERQLPRSLAALHPLQETLVAKTNRRMVEESGLSPELKREFVGFLRADPTQASVVSSVRIEA